MNRRERCGWSARAVFVALCWSWLWAGGCGKKEEPPAVTAAAPPSPSAPAPAEAARPPAGLAAVDRILDTLDWGNIAFNAPSSLEVTSTAQIQLLLSLEQSMDDLRTAITAAGEKEGAHIQVAPRMEARLTGARFQITAITPEQQAIASKGRTEWQWEIRPTQAGRHALHLTLSALFTVDGAASQRAIRTFDKTIDVQVTLGHQVSAFLATSWQWLWAAVLVPVVAWLGKRWRERRTGKT